MKKICVLGSTGSIGTQTLENCEALSYPVTGLCAHKNAALLEEQARRYTPALLAVTDEEAARDVKVRLSDLPVKILAGKDAAAELAATVDADLIVNAMGGMVGLAPSLAAAARKLTLATANKESIVSAGHLIRKAAEESGCTILPIDSEHSAMFQCMQGKPNEKRFVRRLLLTASGGPFRSRSPEELWDITPEEAAHHPIWKMGKKVSIDSATLMNKGLELIEAVRLFDIPEENITVLIHPQSVIHSMAEFCDGAILAQLGTPDMRTCIKFALTYPERRDALNHPLSFDALDLNFSTAKPGDYPMIDLARDAIRLGGAAPCALNAADEAALDLFMRRKIRFPDIFTVVHDAYERHKYSAASTAEEYLALDSGIKREITNNGR